MRGGREAILLEHAGLPGPVSFEDCPEVLDLLRRCYLEWPFAPNVSEDSPLITVARVADHYTMHSRHNPQTIRHTAPLDMACAFVAELFWPYLEANPRFLCLHGGAVEFAGRLVVFPNRYRTGKSLLSACLAARGRRLFTDDVLPVETDSGRGVAMGVRPRLRIPLPAGLSSATLDFVNFRWGPASNRYVYLELGRDEMAAAGESMEIGAFVVLERGEKTRLTISEVSRGEVLSQVVWQNFARELHSATIIETLHGIVERAPCYRLQYEHAEDATALLGETFDDWSKHRVDTSPMSRIGVPGTSPGDDALRPSHYLRRPGIFETILEGERFLAGNDGRSVYHLNPVGSGIWQALAEPMTAEDLVDLVSSAFPTTNRQTIETDVVKLIDDLLARNLIRAGKPAPTDQSG